jgi:hypothetical protein
MGGRWSGSKASSQFSVLSSQFSVVSLNSGRARPKLGGGGVAAIITAGFVGAARNEYDDGVGWERGLGCGGLVSADLRLAGIALAFRRRWATGERERDGRGWEYIGRLEAAARELKLGKGAQNPLLEIDDCRIGRATCSLVAEPFQGGAEDGNESGGGFRHNR